ncbi:MAG: hypothetical protein ACT4QE_18125 [Anaerolineales bacterium]
MLVTINRAFQLAFGLSLVLILALVVEAALFIGNVRIGQAALDEAARAAARAVDVVEVNGVATHELRLTEVEGRPSAYTLAEEALAAAANRVTLTDIVSDGGMVLVRGTVHSPTLFLRVFGVNEIAFELVTSAGLDAP